MRFPLPQGFLDPHRVLTITVVGCGGTGASLLCGLPYLHQTLVALGFTRGLEVTAVDGDRISLANCVRQPFCEAEIGQFKATTLINRLNLFLGTRWHAVQDYLRDPSPHPDTLPFDWGQLVISCVDTRAARASLVRHFESYSRYRRGIWFWLDLGNTAQAGQFVLGQPRPFYKQSSRRLRTVDELFPEILDPTLDDLQTPSCSAVESLTRQGPFLNQVLAQRALQMLAHLFTKGYLLYHGGFENATTGRFEPLRVDPQARRRLERQARQHQRRVPPSNQ